MRTSLAKQPEAADAAPLILIVDDEASIRRSLEGVFTDEGFRTCCAADAETAFQLIEKHHPSTVLLDIWLPGMDGLEVLTMLKSRYPSLPVIMISGHATIATAIRATKLGAFDFIEKPLNLEVTLRVVNRALGQEHEPSNGLNTAVDAEEGTSLTLGRVWDASSMNPIAFASQPLPGRRFPQRTLAQSTLMYGQGLHSGKKSGLILEPLPPNSGIHFAGVSETTIVPAHVEYVSSTGFATTLRLGNTQAGTIEHLMSALHAYGISNLLVKCNGEVPVMDGSSQEFCRLFDEVGVEEQPGDWFEIKVPHAIQVGNDREFIRIEPADEFIIDYTLDYPQPVGKHRMVFKMDDVESYKREISPCRTFGFVKDIGALQKQGLALGGRFDNFVLIGDEGPINGAMRFPDEPVRHKILDTIGDLYLLGRRIAGKVTACMTGHSDNIAILKALREELVKSQAQVSSYKTRA